MVTAIINTMEGTNMLILTRRNSQTFYIGDDITVTVLDLKGNQARIGIEAPKTVEVDREEIRRRKQASTTRPA
jgi:carbon storage regulator